MITPARSPRFLRRGGEVRRDDDVVEPEQLASTARRRRRRARRRPPCPTEPRPRTPSFVDKLAARGVHDPDAVAHLRERSGVEQAARLLRQRQVEGEEVRGGKDVVGIGRMVCAELAEALGSDERVVADDAHAEPERSPHDLSADPAEAQDAQGLVGQLDSAPLRPLPPPRLQRRMRLRDVARQRDEQTDRVLHSRDYGRVGSVRDHGHRVAAFTSTLSIPTGPADHLRTLGFLDQLRGQLRRRADHDRVVAADDLLEQGVTVDIDVEARAQEIDPAGAISSRTRTLRLGLPVRKPRARDEATPRSIGAPSSPSTTSTAARAVAMSNSSYHPMWPIRKIASLSSPCRPRS